MQASTQSRVDVREVPPRERHALILATFRGLSSNAAMELVNDHDPQPLHEQFQAQMPGRFGWEYVERGPAVWRVQITKLSAGHANGACCGSCGGV